jgi:hypothetical protein
MMTTTSPSWWPAWPASFPDISAVYDQTIRRVFGNLYEDVESDEYKDVGAIAEVFSLVAQGSTWIRHRIFPQADAGAVFLDLWEAMYGLFASGTVTQRQSTVVRTSRYTLGTATEDAVRAIFAPIFGDDGNPDAIVFTSPSAADLEANPPTTEEEWARATTSLHISHNGETTEPDRKAALDAIEQCKGAHETWTVGRYAAAKWDTQAGWDTGCWSA